MLQDSSFNKFKKDIIDNRVNWKGKLLYVESIESHSKSNFLNLTDKKSDSMSVEEIKNTTFGLKDKLDVYVLDDTSLGCYYGQAEGFSEFELFPR